MAYRVTQADINLLYQSEKIIYTKIELLSPTFKILDSIETHCINYSYSGDANSDIRRNISLELLNQDNIFDFSNCKKLFVNRFLRVYIGYENQRTKQIQWYKKGTFVFTELNYSFDAVSNIVTLTLEDMMALFNGDIDGQTDGLDFKIPANSYIRDVIISIITQLGKITKYRVDDIKQTIPYDLEFSAGTTVHAMLSEVCNLYAGWEFFFDENGVFVFQKIPNGLGDDIVLDDYVLNDLIVSENKSVPVAVKNVTEVWGKCLEPDRYAQSCTYNASTNTYTLNFTNMSVLENGLMYAFTVPTDNQADCNITIMADNTNLGTFKLIVNDTDKTVYVPQGELKANVTYVVKYTLQKMYYLGQFQIHAIYKNEDLDNPFSVPNLGKEIWDIKADGEYAKIYSDNLAMERAKYENRLTTIIQDSISLELVDIPWLDVNTKIKYTSRTSGETFEYLVSKVDNSDLNGTMNITMIRFYKNFAVNEEV